MRRRSLDKVGDSSANVTRSFLRASASHPKFPSLVLVHIAGSELLLHFEVAPSLDEGQQEAVENRSIELSDRKASTACLENGWTWRLQVFQVDHRRESLVTEI